MVELCAVEKIQDILGQKEAARVGKGKRKVYRLVT